LFLFLFFCDPASWRDHPLISQKKSLSSCIFSFISFCGSLVLTNLRVFPFKHFANVSRMIVIAFLFFFFLLLLFIFVFHIFFLLFLFVFERTIRSRPLPSLLQLSTFNFPSTFPSFSFISFSFDFSSFIFFVSFISLTSFQSQPTSVTASLTHPQSPQPPTLLWLANKAPRTSEKAFHQQLFTTAAASNPPQAREYHPSTESYPPHSYPFKRLPSHDFGQGRNYFTSTTSNKKHLRSFSPTFPKPPIHKLMADCLTQKNGSSNSTSVPNPELDGIVSHSRAPTCDP